MLEQNTIQIEEARRSEVKALFLLITSGALFLLCAFLVLRHITTNWDIQTFKNLNDFLPHSMIFDTIMVYSTLIGREVVWSIVVITLGFSKKISHRRTAFYLIVTLAATAIPGYASQFLVDRLRPFEVVPNANLLVAPLSSPSFPSGHTLVVCAFVTLVWFTLPSKKADLLLTLSAAIVSFSRVYTGEHFPMDVIAGVFLGIAIGSAVMVFQTKIDKGFLKADSLWNGRVLERLRKKFRRDRRALKNKHWSNTF